MASPKKRIGIIQILLLFGNVLSILLLLFSYLASYINPNTFSYIAFAGLAYPYILLLNLIFVVIWIFVRIKFALFSVLFILLGWNQMFRVYQFPGGNSNPLPDNKMKLVSYNAQNFIKVNTTNTKYITDFTNQNLIVEFLQNQKADIYCIQEMLNDRISNSEFIRRMSSELDCPHYYFENYYSKSKKIVDAVAVFTKYKIIDKGHIQFDDKTIGIFVDVIKGPDTLRVYNLHLASIHFRKEDIDFWTGIGQQQDQEEIKLGTRNILDKMNKAFQKRARQANIVSDHVISGSPFPVIVQAILTILPRPIPIAEYQPG
ncbi:MAG: hypothetical protein R2750_01095 [Bacteroidales bacterium]